MIFIRPTVVPRAQLTNMFEIITVFTACVRLSFGCPASTDHTSAEPKTREWVAHFAITSLRGGKLTIYGDGKQMRDLLYVEDLVELMSRACADIEHTAGLIYNIGGGPANTISVWAELRQPLERLVGTLPPVYYREFRPGDQRIYVSDVRKAQEKLKWMP